MNERLDDLRRRKEEALNAGSERAVQRQHDKGKMLARERIEYLLDPGSFNEIDMLVRHRAHDSGLEERPYTDGVITGWGAIDGRKVFVFSQDFTVFGGALGEVFAQKLHKVMDLAQSVGAPMIGLNDGAGARIQEGVVSLDGYGGIFWRNVQASGVIPQISVVLGPCAGGAVYSPAMTDFIFMVREKSHMFITGPDVVKTVTGEEITLEELGGASSHSTKSGVSTFVGETEEEVIASMEDLRNAKVDIITLGQYLQPSKKHLPVAEFITPEQFKKYETLGKEMGFRHVESGALVRSSYKAHKHIA